MRNKLRLQFGTCSLLRGACLAYLCVGAAVAGAQTSLPAGCTAGKPTVLVWSGSAVVCAAVNPAQISLVRMDATHLSENLLVAGPVGPAGQQGPPGPVGKTGPQGA